MSAVEGERLKVAALADAGDIGAQKKYGSMLRDGIGGLVDLNGARVYFQAIIYALITVYSTFTKPSTLLVALNVCVLLIFFVPAAQCQAGSSDRPVQSRDNASQRRGWTRRSRCGKGSICAECRARRP